MNFEFWLNFGINAVFSLVDSTIKNPTSRMVYRRVMTKLRDALNMAFPVEEYGIGTSKISDADWAAGRRKFQ